MRGTLAEAEAKMWKTSSVIRYYIFACVAAGSLCSCLVFTTHGIRRQDKLCFQLCPYINFTLSI